VTTDIHTLAGAYVLDAVDDVERAAFARHLAECESCAIEVAELRESVARLADPTWSVPPPRLRDEVLERVRRTRQEPPGRAGRDGVPALARWRRRTAAAVAAGILAAGAGATTYAVQEQRVRDERAAAVAARSEAERIRAVLAAPDAVVRDAAIPGGGRVTLVASAGLDAGVVLLGGAPAPGADHAYQLWLISSAGVSDAGVLAAGASSATRVIGGVRGAQGIGMTLEPAGGSRTPNYSTLVKVPLA
jgi:anti-sigma-K factor RskA